MLKDFTDDKEGQFANSFTESIPEEWDVSPPIRPSCKRHLSNPDVSTKVADRLKLYRTSLFRREEHLNPLLKNKG